MLQKMMVMLVMIMMVMTVMIMMIRMFIIFWMAAIDADYKMDDQVTLPNGGHFVNNDDDKIDDAK